MSCYGCVCNYCLYNAELESWYMTPGEVQDIKDICFCCDECKYYDGDYSKHSQWRPECGKQKLPCRYVEMQRKVAAERSGRVAEARRRNFEIIEGGL